MVFKKNQQAWNKGKKMTDETKEKISASRKGKYGYVGKMKCNKCFKEVISYTTQQIFCSDCRKLHHNEWKKEYLSKEDNNKRHHDRCNKWRRNNLDRKRIHQKKYISKNPQIQIAQKMAEKYVKLNNDCDICHSTNNLQRHHWRYDKPLLVNTLCQTCHNIQHIKHFETSVFGRH